MIHQFIFAGPKPGLSAAEFQRYWIEVHAVQYAVKIRQIRRYLVALRCPTRVGCDVPFFEGVAEIWLDDDRSQLESLQSAEFVDGARVDEPRWAAFWRTFVLDTESRSWTAGRDDGADTVGGENGREGESRPLTKLYALLKRRPGSDLEAFRQRITTDHADAVQRLPGLRRHMVALARDNQYGLGEPRFDAIDVLAFDDARAVEAAVAGLAFDPVKESWESIADGSARFAFVGEEHWVIRPGER